MKNKYLIFISLILMMAALLLPPGCTPASDEGEKNLALLATPGGSSNWGFYAQGLNDGETPMDSLRWRGRQGRPRPASQQWIEYTWQSPVNTNRIDLFLWDFYGEWPLPPDYRIEYWNGESYQPVADPVGLGLVSGQYNTTEFTPVETTKLRIVVDSAQFFLGKVMEWKVLQASGYPDAAPVISTNGDRDVMKTGKTYLTGEVKSMTGLYKATWKKVSGPGKIIFDAKNNLETTASFDQTGSYELSLQVKEKGKTVTSNLLVHVHDAPSAERLDVVYTRNYSIDNPLWNDRAKVIITEWIPWCIEQIERTDLTEGLGGLDNFREAAKAIRGESHGRHLGYVFSNAWVHQTVESMAIALMVDAGGDPDILKAQELFKKKLDEWIPVILSAQEPDGYLQTAYTLRDTIRWKNRWEADNRSAHEGYVAGYFIESAINHYTLTNGQDTRLYDAAKKLSDCWVANIAPDKIAWFDGHQEMEQALVRFGRFVNDMEGNGRGDAYIDLAKFLLDNRADGDEYDQSHVHVQQQYEAVGHAVRAVYNYSAMADVAAETGDVDYQSAVMSLWNNMVNKKYYVTGGVGSGETSEGFGENYSLPHDAYCESCSSCGLIFFQYKMNLAYHDAKYADLYEETMYNALLGSLDLEGKNFYYTNQLNNSRPRYPWHVCPCCVGNIPRTLLMVPTWTYTKSDDGIFVNLYIGSTILVDRVAGTNVQMVQKTDYPWAGSVDITVNPEQEAEFTLYVRVPNRHTSELYTSTPDVSGLNALTVNGESVALETELGYIPIRRTWKKGDQVHLEIPMEIQRIQSDEQIQANRGMEALRYGPLIYAFEKVDQANLDQPIGPTPLTTAWQPDLLHGVITINGQWADGTPLVAIPYWTRNNRLDQADPQERHGTRVWVNRSK